jgi:hypothetical protein
MIEETWIQPYLAYMINKKLPEDAVEAKRITRRSKCLSCCRGNYTRKVLPVFCSVV